MKSARWMIFAGALGLIAGTALWLHDIRGRNLLGSAGVRVEQVPIYDTKTNLVSAQSVVLPSHVDGMLSTRGLVDSSEVIALPRDTTYGLRYYRDRTGDFSVQLSVILMGTDHTSIHQPQYCLYAQNWTITNQERITLHMDRPVSYEVPAVKITATQQDPRTGQSIECFYIYWFVSGDKITAEEGSRLWSMWKTMLRHGELERWAYISYFATCVPGAEQETFNHLEKFIEASAPDFQTTTGQTANHSPSTAGTQ